MEEFTFEDYERDLQEINKVFEIFEERRGHMPNIDWEEEMEERSRNIPEPISVNQNITIDVGALKRAVEELQKSRKETPFYQKTEGGNWYFKDKYGIKCGPFDTKKQVEREYKKY